MPTPTSGLLTAHVKSASGASAETETIFIRSTKKPLAPGLQSNDARATVWSSYSSQLPRTCELASQLALTLNGDLARVFLVRLRARGTVYAHADTGSYYASRDRFHVILQSGAPLHMVCGGSSVEMHPGDVWWYDNSLVHELINPAESPAIYMIVDLLPKTVRPHPGSAFEHFELVDPHVDIRPFLAELDSHPELWEHDTSRQDSIKVQRETSNIPLRGASKPVPAGIAVRDVHPSRTTELAQYYPSIYQWASDFAARVGGELGRLTIVRLNPGGTVHPHIDEGEYYLSRDRYHLVLASTGGSEMQCGSETVVFREGQLWWFDNKASHSAYNPSQHSRIHIIFDVKPARNYADPAGPVTLPPSHAEPLASPPGPSAPTMPVETVQASVAESLDWPDMAQWLCATIRQATPMDAPPPTLPAGTVLFIGLHAGGKGVANCWWGDSASGDLRSMLAEIRTGVVAQLWQRIDSIELFHAVASRPVANARPDQLQALLGDSQRGLTGIEARVGADRQVIRLSPFEMIASNRDFGQSVERMLESTGDSDKHIELTLLAGPQYRIHTAPQREHGVSDDSADAEAHPHISHLYRCREFVPIDAINTSYLETLAELLGNYLTASVQDNGEMQYIYYPSRGTADTARNNQIRQWMATLALCRWARFRGDDAVFDIADRNIQFNLNQYYSKVGDLGIIDDQGKIKLGAVALAAMAIRQHPRRSELAEVEASLLGTVNQMWTVSGRFRTFLAPPERDDCHNFYPGEALLLWSQVYRERQSGEVLDRFAKSFEYYRAWHRDNRNPAFIPWHTQAYWLMWCQLVGDWADRMHDAVYGGLPNALRNAIFAMNDWLLGIQQWEDAPGEDCRGRFYAPDRPFGPPHASSTAVYLEGLLDAYQLASRVGDRQREAAYRQAIFRGFRSLAQLTFKDDGDMFYISRRSRVRGGVATTAYNNIIRIDNVQHALMAMMKAIRVLPSGS